MTYLRALSLSILTGFGSTLWVAEASAQNDEIALENYKQMAQSQVDSMYSDFLDGLDVDDNQRARIRQALIDASAEVIGLSMRMMTGDITSEEAEALDDGTLVTDRLAAVLNKEQLELFADYRLAMARRQLQSSYRRQLAAAAPNLGEENAQLVLDIVVQELTGAQEFNGAPGSSGDSAMDAAMERQLDALGRARDRINAELDGNQLAESQKFIDQLHAGIRLGREMMRSDPRP